jgi:hypothetical protein
LKEDITNYNQNDPNFSLCAYYDMRYMEYVTRHRFLLGLALYNEDDTAFEREEIFKKLFRDNSEIQNWIQEQKRESEKRDYYLAHNPMNQVLKDMSTHIQKESQFDKRVDEYLLNVYQDIDEQELQVCRTLVWAMWDLHSGRNIAHYADVVEHLLNPKYQRKDIFETIKDIQDTIQRLVYREILSQDKDRIGGVDKDGNTRWKFDKPFITLSFTKALDDVIRTIAEGFSQEVLTFFGPHNNYNSKHGHLASKKSSSWDSELLPF